VNTLIVYAHPEPTSFNGAMKDVAFNVLTQNGHQVRVSDLYAMDFNPVAGPRDVQRRVDTKRFDLLSERAEAFRQGTLADDIVAEQEKVLWADFLIFQFPMWWWSVPAILKGWFDRVLMSGFAYSDSEWYDTGKLKGKRAILSITTGAGRRRFAPQGLYGDMDERLYSLQHGTLRYTGLDVLPPMIAWAVEGADEATRAAFLDQYRERLHTIDSVPSIPFLGPADYDDRGRLKPGRAIVEL